MVVIVEQFVRPINIAANGYPQLCRGRVRVSVTFGMQGANDVR